MPHVTDDRVLETSSTTGTGAYTVLGAVPNYIGFAAAQRPDTGLMTIGDTFLYEAWGVDASGNPNGGFESGVGTWGASSTIARTQILRSSNAGAAVNWSTGTRYIAITAIASRTLQFDNEFAILLPPASVASVANPPAGFAKFFNRILAGRSIPSWKSSVGDASRIQPSLWDRAVGLYLPNTGTTLGINNGLPWVGGGTISHPTPASTAPAIVNQMRRSRFANVVTTTNQVLGVGAFASGVQQFWRGSAVGLGGFFFHARFTIELWPAATVRLFVGLSDQTTAVVASDTLAGNSIGLWHDTTMAATVLNFMSRNGTTATNVAITLATALAAGQAFDFYMYSDPNGSVINYRLDEINTGTTLVDTSTSTTIPANTVFMGPQVHMSNGTANITVTTVAIGVAKIYTESWK